MKCNNCDGQGWKFMAPEGVNPFYVRLPALAQILERRTCWKCRGTGAQVQRTRKKSASEMLTH